MGWLRSVWQKAKKPLKIAGIILTCALVIGLIVSFIGGYFFNWTWTGFGPYTPPKSDYQREKTLWDWLQLFFIPAAIAFGVLWFSHLQQQRDQQLADQRAQTEREIAEDNQREAAMKEYFSNMSELLLNWKLLKSEPDSEARIVARVLTLTVLHRLDSNRKRNVLQFLKESSLIRKDNLIVDLDGADFSGANLMGANLRKANLSGVDLTKAYLIEAKLSQADLGRAVLIEAVLSKVHMWEANLVGANLYKAVLLVADLRESDLGEANLIEVSLMGANLRGANLTGAHLSEADLRLVDLTGADLTGAIVTDEQLNQAKSLAGAIMPDGTTHD